MPEFVGLKSAPAVMTWRRVSDLKHADTFATRVAGWPKVGENKYANIYDAGTALLGYWVQDKFIKEVAKEVDVPPEKLKPSQAAGVVANCCDLNFDKFALVSNPATEIVLAPQNFRTAVERLGKAFGLVPTVKRTEAGEGLSFVDSDGNFSGLVRPAARALAGGAGAKLKTLMKRAPASGKKAGSRLVGYNLLVSNLKASVAFYRDVLRLAPLGTANGMARFDIGSMILTLNTEPAAGLVRSLARTKRLQGDWIMFYVPEIKVAFNVLKKRGVDFPIGIEESGHGLGALFTDPDGHVLTIWQPPAEPLDIDYFPVLNRVLKNVA